ncbi:ABC transporter ATP-binding protein [Paludicola sp. MB14-C6]|uniref:ABC transporter ATP-binding protein n=1 Tax=Paludihabitans sp. MB14-C6 TaxID=3070656 RepID=UPI0027DCE0EB|nr:ABC transporter ATP-binding protein [Paludicola sp. MB14-C6]WMJ23903.1 ABC transporter ATP-binding protein [Paludicola sp. MB14-C6]
MMQLARFLKNYKKEVIIGPIFKLTEAIFELIVPIVMMKIIDIGIKNKDMTYVLQMGGILVLLGVVGLGCSLTCQFFAAKASQGFGTDVRNALFKHIISFSHSEIDQFGTPSLITRLNNDVNQLQVAVAMLIRLVVRAPFLAIGATIMAILLDLQLSVIFLITAPFIALILYLVMSKSIPFYKNIQKGLDKVSLIIRENLSGSRVIRAFSKQKYEEQRFIEASDELKNKALQVGKISALLSPLTTIVINFAIIAIVWWGGIRVNVGSFSQGEIIAFVNYLSQILIALIIVANLVVLFTKAFASAKRVNELFDTTSSICEPSVIGNTIVDTKTKIILRDVCFSYQDSQEYSLHNINLSIQKGETIGIIGGTGAGKSTLIQLLPRFYDVTSGEILIDGMDVRHQSLQTLRKQFGIVPQRAVLFSGTIRDNMKWANPNASDEEINQALEIAQAKDFVDQLENGLDTIIVQDGKNLSGGQKQRLTIARALVGNPQILILDDSASALDYATDAALRKAIHKQIKHTTVLIVSQRVSAVKSANRIVVLDDGEIAGIGTHQELFNACQVYKDICLSQLSDEEVARG